MSRPGFVNVLKPPGLSSGDVVGLAKRRLQERQVGHVGTLDPLAAGVLPLAVGWGTRLIPFLPPSDPDKAYTAEACLGVTTDSQDAAGQVVRVEAVPTLSFETLQTVLEGMVGSQAQVPPMASAVHHQGKRLYELHRAGLEVERTARPITVHCMTLLRWASPRLLFQVQCSAGTYVRTLCHDLGERLGCGAHMSFLVRTASGAFQLEDAVTLEDLGPDSVLDPDRVLAGWPAVVLTPETLQKIRHGQSLSPVPTLTGLVRLQAPAGRLVAMAEASERRIHPVCVLPNCLPDVTAL